MKLHYSGKRIGHIQPSFTSKELSKTEKNTRNQTAAMKMENKQAPYWCGTELSECQHFFRLSILLEKCENGVDSIYQVCMLFSAQNGHICFHCALFQARIYMIQVFADMAAALKILNELRTVNFLPM